MGVIKGHTRSLDYRPDAENMSSPDATRVALSRSGLRGEILNPK